MKKLISLILAVCMIAAIVATIYADNTTPSRPALSYLAEQIQARADYTEAQGDAYRLWRWKPELPSSEGKEAWLTYYYIDGDPNNGNFNVTMRTESGIYYMALMLGDWGRVWVDATNDTTLPDTFFSEAPGPDRWKCHETRGAETIWISGKFRTTAYTVGTEPSLDLESSFSEDVQTIRDSQIYQETIEMICWMVDSWQYVLKQGGFNMHDAYFYCLSGLCRWHEWDDGDIYDPPTTTHPGRVRYTCTRCSKSRIELIPKLRFADVPETAYYAPAVDWATDNGVVAGTSETDFSPNAKCTRAQIVQMLWRSAGSPESETETPFTDVAANAYYAEAVAWAYENGITNGVSATRFGSNSPCSRAQIVTMLWRANGSPESSVQTRFADVTGSEWYAQAVRWAAERGITAGKRGNTFAAFDVCTRAEAVTFLWRADGGEE